MTRTPPSQPSAASPSHGPKNGASTGRTPTSGTRPTASAPFAALAASPAASSATSSALPVASSAAFAAANTGPASPNPASPANARTSPDIGASAPSIAPAAQLRAPSARLARRGYSTLMKSLFRLTHPRDQRHNERLWPHVTVSRDSQDRIIGFSLGARRIPIANADPESLRSIEARKRQEQGQPTAAHLIACGPSISRIDYTVLRPTPALGVNGAIALSHSQGVRFDYYCITDAGFIRGRPEMVADIVSQDMLLFTTPLCLWYILQYIPAASLVCRIFLIERVGRPTHRSRVAYDKAVAACPDCMTLSDPSFGVGFSENIRKGIFPGGTVAFEGLQILAWLGFETIHIHGVDLSDASKQPRFYETQASMLPTTLDLSLWTEIEPSFRHAAQRLRQRGIAVHNLSPCSALGEDIFKKIDWRDLLKAT